MTSGLCECKAGQDRGPCKQKDAIAKFYELAKFSALPDSDVNMRALYHFIAAGTVCTNSWYRDLDAPNALTDIATFVEHRNEQAGADTITVVNEFDKRNDAEALMQAEEASNDESISEEDDSDRDMIH